MAKTKAKPKSKPKALRRAQDKPAKPAAKVKAPKVTPEKYAAMVAEERAAFERQRVEARNVPYAALFPSPLNPRKFVGDAEALRPLADSIVAEGILMSLLVRPLRRPEVKGDAFEIIAGERRWRAVGLAIAEGRLPRDYALPVRVRQATDAELVELAATENMGREDMHPLDEAEAIAAMRRFHKEDAEIWRRLGIPERTFYRRAALLRLVPELKQDLRDGKITLQQAAAFSLGTAKAQRNYRKKLEAQDSSYWREPNTIRRDMIENSVRVTRALFPLAQYTGEILDDPETGERYFADRALFDKLQDAAIKAKVEALKAMKLAFVKKVDGWQQSSYGKAKNGDKGAGAIWWLDPDGSFHSRAPVLSAEATSAQRAKSTSAERLTLDAAESAGLAGGAKGAPAAPAPEPHDEAAEARERERSRRCDAVMEQPQRALALLALNAIRELALNLEECDTEAERERVGKIRAAVLPIVAAALGLASTDELVYLDDDLGEDEPAVKLFNALAALDRDALLRLLIAAEAEHLAAQLVDDFRGKTLTPLGMAFLQRELPLAPAAPAEAAQ